MLALPLKREGNQLLDANGVSIALIRGEILQYRERGAEIIAAVNSRVDYAPLEIKYADLLKAAKAGLDALSDFDACDLEMSDDLVTSMQNGIEALQDAIAKAEKV